MAGVSITILLLIAGVSIGLNKSVGSKFGAVGVISVVFSIATSIGSVIMFYTLTKKLDRRRKNEDNNNCNNWSYNR